MHKTLRMMAMGNSKRENTPTFNALMRDPLMFLAFGFGSGLSRYVPGTMGTLACVPLYLLMAQTSFLIYLFITVVATLVGIYLCEHSAKKLGVHDHSGIVWDEFAGFFITMIAIPLSWQTLLAGFVLFRFFDMLKPWPISVADKKLGGGFGIMFDDVLAGGAAWACLYALVYTGVL